MGSPTSVSSSASTWLARRSLSTSTPSQSKITSSIGMRNILVGGHGAPAGPTRRNCIYIRDVNERDHPEQAANARRYQIGEVATMIGLSLRTIRHYEEAGVVTPSGRSPGGFPALHRR